MNNLVIGKDLIVADWMFREANCNPMLFNMAIGIDNEAGDLVGGFMFTGYNGSDAEVHFIGPKTLKRNIVRAIFTIAVMHFNLNRLTIRTRKESMARGVLKLGAVYEGTIKRLYGPSDESVHTGKQYVFFRETMEKLAGIGK